MQVNNGENALGKLADVANADWAFQAIFSEVSLRNVDLVCSIKAETFKTKTTEMLLIEKKLLKVKWKYYKKTLTEDQGGWKSLTKQEFIEGYTILKTVLIMPNIATWLNFSQLSSQPILII